MLFVTEYDYNTRKWRGDVCPSWLHREAVRLDLLDRIVYAGF
jgi:hypothetical protein